MQRDTSQNSRVDFVPWLMMAGGVAFIVALIVLTKEGVFFSGDAGLKYLMLRQMKGGGSYSILNAVKEDWVMKIWHQGFFPFREPFVYDVPTGRVVAFPPAFQWVSLPFYRLMGYRGLYLIPAASIVLLWVSFWKLIGTIDIPVRLRWLLLAVLVFASPLTIYGGLYWEHAIAVSLGFAGISFIARRSSPSLIAGIVFGLSVWFRPEMLAFCGLAFLSQLIFWRSVYTRQGVLFFIGMSIPVIAFFIFNNLVYGHLLGAHALQFLSDDGTAGYKPSFLNLLTHINFRLLEFFPASIFLVLIIYSLFRQRKYSTAIYQLTFIITCFLIVIPFFIPNAGGKQWGPRYLLPVIPAILVLYALVYSAWRKSVTGNEQLATPIRFFFILTSVMGLLINIFWAYAEIRDDYRDRVAPALSWINADKTSVIVLQNQYISLEMAAAFDQKNFFVAETDEQLAMLVDDLVRAGVGRINYLCYRNGPGINPQALKAGYISSVRKGNYLVISCQISKGLK